MLTSPCAQDLGPTMFSSYSEGLRFSEVSFHTDLTPRVLRCKPLTIARTLDANYSLQAGTADLFLWSPKTLLQP